MDRHKTSSFYFRNFREYRRRDASSRIPAHDLLSRDNSKLKVEYDFLEQCLHREKEKSPHEEESEEDQAIDLGPEIGNQFYVRAYQMDSLKEDYSDLEEDYCCLQRELRDKTRAYELLARDYAKLKSEYEFLEQCLNQRDGLLEENNLAAVEMGDLDPLTQTDSTANGVENFTANESNNGTAGAGIGSDPKVCDDSCSSPINWDDDSESGISGLGSTLTDRNTTSGIGESIESLLGDVSGISIDEKIRNVINERSCLIEEVKILQEELEGEKSFNTQTEDLFIAHHCSDPEICRHQEKLLIEYRRELDTADSEVGKLEANLRRLEVALESYKSLTEKAEEREKDLQEEKRRVLRQYREAESRIDELEGINSLLHRKIAKLKTSKLSTDI